MSAERTCFGLFVRICLIVAVIASSSAVSVAAQEVCGDAHKVTRLGNPVSRFSSPVTSVDALQNLVSNARADIAALLAQSGFQGDAEDFFAAVANGDGVSSTSVDPGTHLGWMFARDRGNPVVKRDICWAGKAPFRAFEVQFASRGTWYSFVVPEACGNFSLLAQQEEPVCKVSLRDTAGDTCDRTDLLIDATGSTGNVSVELIGPSGDRQTLTSSSSSTRLRWTVASKETKGTYRAVVTSSQLTPRGNTLECRAEQAVARDCCIAGVPSITLTADPDSVEQFQDSVITADPSVSECTTMDSVTIDGEPVKSPFQVTANYPEPGVYAVSGKVLDGRGQSASDEVDITVTECVTKDCKKQRKAYVKEQRRLEREGRGRGSDASPVVGTRKGSAAGQSAAEQGAGGRKMGALEAGTWILRAWLAKWDADDEVRFTENDGVREAFRLDNGSGFGIQLERLFNQRVGLGVGALLVQTEVQYELDLPNAWGMNDDDVDALTLFVGPVFHLTPDHPVDVIVSPFVGYTDFGSGDFNALGRSVSADFDNEFSWGAQLGVDVPFGQAGWGAHAGAIYQSLDMESTNQGFTFQVDPLSLDVGLFFRF